MPRWLAAVAEYEALAALATYAAEHPSHPFPEIVDGDATFEADELAHPLLPADTAVANDVQLGGSAPHLLLVSGSNMSGKSTLLRTVGLNAVLAQAGAPVRARRLAMTPLRIGATLRIQDSLQAGRSRFFAEITRISAIVKLTERATPARTAVLFLLDELLAGTNSHDRLEGATGILSGLVDRGAIGLATTHDLALTAIADRLGGRGAERAFRGHLRGRHAGVRLPAQARRRAVEQRDCADARGRTGRVITRTLEIPEEIFIRRLRRLRRWPQTGRGQGRGEQQATPGMRAYGAELSPGCCSSRRRCRRVRRQALLNVSARFSSA